jgi:hypothetical protein
MRFSPRISVVFALLLLVGVSAFAQVTSSLAGKVILDNSPLPGVTVTIASPSLQGSRTSVTDINGSYNFSAIPPGDYAVKFEMEGLRTVTETIHIGLNMSGRADTTMKVSALTEAITVTAGAPAVLETSEIQANVQAKLVQELPMGRRFQDAALLTAGVNNNGPNAGTSITISGAPAYDSVFMVNGAVVNENLRGQAHNLFIEDAIQETTVLTGGISAEYGRFTGGVVNTITKSGGNQFSGSLRDSMTNDKWTALNKKFYDVKGIAAPARNNTTNSTYEGTFGGRILRDRLWFFVAGRDLKLTSGASLATSPQPGSTVGPTYTATDTNKRWEGKLTGQITQKHSLVVSYLNVTEPQTNNCFISCYDFTNLDVARSLPNSFYSGHYSGIITDQLLVEANYSKKRFAFVGSGGHFQDRVNGTAWYDLNTGAFFGAPVFCAICGSEHRDNTLWSAKANYYLASKSFGTHSIIVGGENWSETRLSNNYQSGSNYFLNINNSPVVRNGISYPEFDVGDIIQYSPIFTLSKGSKFQTASAYINDKWDVNSHWSANIGVRYDKDNGADSSGATVAKGSAISPRLGLIYDVKGNGRLRINASYSKYVSKIPETIGGGGTGAGNPASIYYEYRGPTINANNTLTFQQVAQQVFNWFDSVGGLKATDLITFARVPGVNTLIGNGLQSPSVNEETIGVGSQLGANGFVRVDVVHRDWKNFYATFRNQADGVVRDQFGNTFDLGFIQNSNAFSRKYDALTLQAAFRPMARVDVGGNYTYAKLKGNVTAETSGSGPITESTFTYPEFKAFAKNNPIGYLSSDQRHKVRAWVTYELPTRIGAFNLGAIERFDSGTPYSAAGNISIRYSATSCPTCPNPANLTYVAPPTNVTYYFSPRGAFRWDNVIATDVSLGYQLPIAVVRLFAKADVLNIFDHQAQIGGDTTVLTNRNSTTMKRFDPFTTTPVQGVNWDYGPNFGKPSAATTGSVGGSYQLPRTYRFTFGVRF